MSSDLRLALLLVLAGCSAPSVRPDAAIVRDGGRSSDVTVPSDAPEADAPAPLAPDSGLPDLDAGVPDVDADVPDAGGPSALLVPAEVVCAPTVAACDAPTATVATVGSIRSDHWLRSYAEDTPTPDHGGRVQLVGTAAIGGRVTRVLVDGIDLASIEAAPPAGTTPPFEWWHVWPERPRAGQPIWVAFHSRDARWDTRASASITIETTMGVALSGTFELSRPDVPVSYVTTALGGTELWIHLVNEAATSRRLARLVANGRDVTDSACLPSRELAPGASLFVRVPQCTALTAGDAWSVVVEWASGPRSVAAGRVLPERFPIEAWNNTTDCPFPGADEGALTMHREAGIDTLYVHGGSCRECGCDTATLLGETLPDAGLSAIATSDLASLTFASTSGIAAFSTGDESDGEIYDEMGIPEAASRARASTRAWHLHPEVPTFNGGKTNRNVGTFAGMADVQALDLYVAACAPHITPFGMHPPLRAPFDYLLNTRLNHRPWPTWLYAQGLSPVWNRGDPEYSVQPDPPEIIAQAFMAIAAGAKGLLWFQSNVGEGEHAPARWQAISDVDAMVGAVRELLRSGDPIGATGTGAVLVEAIRSAHGVVLPVIDLSTTRGPDDIACLLVRNEASVPHWAFADVTSTVSVTIPPDLAVARVLEVTPAGIRPADVSVRVSSRTLSLDGVAVRASFPARLFVLADETLAADLLGAP